jgi:queuine tRNA-ribosyltransferase
LFGITQGGIHPDLREKSCKELSELDFDGFSCGGLALGEPQEKMFEMVKIHKSIVPKEKPTYLMGLGSPPDLLEAISLGVDMFDSRFPTQNARRGTLFTSQGRLRIKRLEHKYDHSPIDKECGCFVCKNYSRAYIHYQLKMEEAVGSRLATFHNLYYLQNLMKESKKNIKNGSYKEFFNKIKRMYS